MSRLLLRALPRTSSSTATLRAPTLTTTFSQTASYSSQPPNNSFAPGPAPPRLPPSEQAEFERLQREAAISSGFRVDDAPSSSSSEPSSSASAQETGSGASTTQTAEATASTAAAAEGTPTSTSSSPQTKGTDFNQGIFRGAPPEFEGERNPKTGEVGGPKNEPLRWGGSGDWSYNGRVTDF